MTRPETKRRARGLLELWASLLLGALVLGGCGANSGVVSVRDARVMLPPPGGVMASGYMQIHNGTSKPVWLTAVRVDGFAITDMHENRMEDGMMRMRPVAEVEVPAGKSVAFEPGGLHLMLARADAGVAAGDDSRITVVLRDSEGRTQELTAAVALQSRGGDPHEGH